MCSASSKVKIRSLDGDTSDVSRSTTTCNTLDTVRVSLGTKAIDEVTQHRDKDGYWVHVFVVARKDASEVTLEAPLQRRAWKKLKWKGGEKGDQANQRLIDRGECGKHTVTAQLAKNKISVEIWVVRARVEVLTMRDRPQGIQAFGNEYGEPKEAQEVLGVSRYEDTDGHQEARGKIVAVATIEPRIVDAGKWETTKVFEFRRVIKRRVWFNGEYQKPEDGNATVIGSDDTERMVALGQDDWLNDTGSVRTFRPDRESKIYDRDAPNVKSTIVVTDTKHTLCYNFLEFVEVNGELCSNEAEWCWCAQWQRNDEDWEEEIKFARVETGHFQLPQPRANAEPSEAPEEPSEAPEEPSEAPKEPNEVPPKEE